MGYWEAIDYILKFTDYERMPRSGVIWDLKRIERLLERLGNPQHSARSVHVAGTKGKGSTAAMIASVLKRAGYRTGLFSSPHLLSFTERIQADGKPIPEADWARLTDIIRPEVEAVNRAGDLGELTTFEILTALAFVWFREIRADYQVMEVGLGGRLDATNVVRPDVGVITSISFDHTDVLGDTLAKIAFEKAGIVKQGMTVVCSPQVPEAMEMIEKVCRERQARLIKAGVDVTWQKIDFTPGDQSFHVIGIDREYDLKIPLLGEYQMENAAAAVVTAEVLSGKGAKITAADIANGLESIDWPGRLQVLRQSPLIIADSAHNAYSVKKLGEALRQYFRFDRAILIIGVSSDKDVSEIVWEAGLFADEVIISRSRHPRAVAPAVLVAEFSKHGITPLVAENVAAAVKLALEKATTKDLICAAGSVFVVAEVIEMMVG